MDEPTPGQTGDAALWSRIAASELEKPSARLPFERRLARDNGWTEDYAERVVEEYRRFAYLATLSPESLAPSETVERAWRQHRGRARLYWDDFCSRVLRKPLHPDDALAGTEALVAMRHKRALRAYEQMFGAVPPDDIWSRPAAPSGALVASKVGPLVPRGIEAPDGETGTRGASSRAERSAARVEGNAQKIERKAAARLLARDKSGSARAAQSAARIGARQAERSEAGPVEDPLPPPGAGREPDRPGPGGQTRWVGPATLAVPLAFGVVIGSIAESSFVGMLAFGIAAWVMYRVVTKTSA